MGRALHLSLHVQGNSMFHQTIPFPVIIIHSNDIRLGTSETALHTAVNLVCLLEVYIVSAKQA
ncbi:hypothetical protein [Paenibacillus luteus]|uniref:hypothetical protein n=1 Tax=Paenibacillus luteus TaxID=2545753 RepID=UPI0019D69257|nr:hypothetical protein [Paenibacillus luteus]